MIPVLSSSHGTPRAPATPSRQKPRPWIDANSRPPGLSNRLISSIHGAQSGKWLKTETQQIRSKDSSASGSAGSSSLMYTRTVGYAPVNHSIVDG